MVQSWATRSVFINSAVAFLNRYEFDGLDLVWEYPAHRDNSPAEDKIKFTYLCSELATAFDNGIVYGKPRLLLTAAVSADSRIIDKAYEVKKLGLYLDILNLMTYDLHGGWESVTGHHTAMDVSGGK